MDEYVHYFNDERPAAALGYKSPVQYKTELGFETMVLFRVYFSLTDARRGWFCL
ncbi:MAG: IS3 family transposase [Clostridiales bacterium]|nr:IS3 family transposase [Candidatus Cacconaster stercorequi]